MKKSFYIFFVLLFSACNALDSHEDPDSVYIRVANLSSTDYNSVYVSFPGAEHTFGPVKSGRSSQYQKFEQAYRYGYIEVKSENGPYVIQPIDYVGESLLENGKYTFELKIEDDKLSLDSNRD